MGNYTARPVTETELKDIIESIVSGYTDAHGVPHKPNKQVATILTLQANIGCLISDICALTIESLVKSGDAWKLDVTENGMPISYTISNHAKAIIDAWTQEKGINSGNLFSINEYAVWKQLRGVTSYLELENVSTHSIRHYYRERSHHGND